MILFKSSGMLEIAIILANLTPGPQVNNPKTRESGHRTLAGTVAVFGGGEGLIMIDG
jgi:hypothetical protein